MTRIIARLDDIAADYDALYCDLWGCVHDGERALPEAVAALRRFREAGGKVVLLTNSPRPRAGVAAQIAGLGVADDAWDVIATSGDSTRAAMFRGAVGAKVHHIGAADETSFFEPLRIVEHPVAITRVPLDEAEGIVCTGAPDPLGDLDASRPDLLYAKQKGLRLLCANPDIVVDRGASREWCAGAVARLYEEMGGESLYFGKPHPPIYDLAGRRLAQVSGLRGPRILAIGDGIATDIQGAMGEDIDALFVTGGLAVQETHTETDPDPDALDRYLAGAQLSPAYAIGYLR